MSMESGEVKLSLGNLKVFSGIQEALVLALMLVSMFVLFYVDIDWIFKIGIAVIVFTIIFLATLAAALLRQQRDLKQTQA
jgi:membrane protein YdbS with pleckstrin-like domain